MSFLKSLKDEFVQNIFEKKWVVSILAISFFLFILAFLTIKATIGLILILSIIGIITVTASSFACKETIAFYAGISFYGAILISAAHYPMTALIGCCLIPFFGAIVAFDNISMELEEKHHDVSI